MPRKPLRTFFWVPLVPSLTLQKQVDDDDDDDRCVCAAVPWPWPPERKSLLKDATASHPKKNQSLCVCPSAPLLVLRALLLLLLPF
uniref:Putative secreted protein n=1 Tax=Anopheles triannulatus TaxID=58253 RepID=A0A2M4B7A4_9DIPT